MVDWKPIERGKVEVHGIDDDASGLLRASMKLSRQPPAEWAHSFENPTGVGLSLSMHPPRLSLNSVVIRPPDAELETYVRHVDERIASANARYERDVLPKLEREEERRNAEDGERRKRIEDAKRRAEGL